MRKVHKSILDHTGDQDPFSYGGGIVSLVRDTERGTERFSWEWWDPTDDDDEAFLVYQVDIPADVWKEHNWITMEDETFSGMVDGKSWSRTDRAKIDRIAESCDIDRKELIRMGTGTLQERVRCLEEIVNYFGAMELDSYPETETPRSQRARWRKQWGHYKARGYKPAACYAHYLTDK